MLTIHSQHAELLTRMFFSARSYWTTMTLLDLHISPHQRPPAGAWSERAGIATNTSLPSYNLSRTTRKASSTRSFAPSRTQGATSRCRCPPIEEVHTFDRILFLAQTVPRLCTNGAVTQDDRVGVKLSCLLLCVAARHAPPFAFGV